MRNTFKQIFCAIAVSIFLFLANSGLYAQTTSFSFTGGMQTWTVPSGISSITVTVNGAPGGLAPFGGGGGCGARVMCSLAVTPGQVINIFVGGAGGNATSTVAGTGGFNGGGAGTISPLSPASAGGGGSSDLRIGGTTIGFRVVSAGGGGGGGAHCGAETGGDGGGAGVAGSGLDCGALNSTTCGQGASPGFAGLGASSGGFPGGSLNGGAGFSPSSAGAGGGGGGGYFGGGGGNLGGGGGGSSFVNVTLGSFVTYGTGSGSGNCSGDGYVLISTSPCTPPVVAPVINTANNVCIGNTITLADATTGGTWSSGSSSVATVGSTGIVTGVSAGNVIISYGVTSGGCTGYGTAFVTVGHEIINTIAGGGVSLGDGGPATAGQLTQPTTVFVDASGNQYVADFGGSRVRKVDGLGIITTVVGTGAATSFGDGFAATAGASVNAPAGVCKDAAGNIYIAEQNGCRVRKINTLGIISTIAGNSACATTGDGLQATAATLNHPTGIATDATGNIYICEWGGGVVRKIDPSGIISRIAGGGVTLGDGGPATAAQLSGPYGISLDGLGNLYISDQSHARVRMVDLASGIITTVVGTGSAGFSGDNNPATAATLNAPTGVYADQYNLYVADGNNNRIRKVNLTTGIITTIVGNGLPTFSGDGGSALAAALHTPAGVTLDASGNIYIADYNSARIRKVTLINSSVAPISGSTSLCQNVPVLFSDATAGGTWTSSNTGIVTIGSSTGVVTGTSTGTAMISYTVNFTCGPISAIWPVTVNAFDAGVISGPSTVCATNTIALTETATGGTWSSSAPGVATVNSGGVVTGVSAGYTAISYSITNACGTKAATQLITVGSEIITTIAGTGAAGYSGDGFPATAAALQGPHGTVVDALGNIYFSDFNNNVIRKISSGGIITTIAGTGIPGYLGDGAPATAARLRNPAGLTMDAGGNMLFADYNNHAIRKITPGGIISTIAGNGFSGFFGDGSPASGAQLSFPVSVYIDAVGNIYIPDANNQRIRKINLSGTISTVAGTGGGAGYNGDGITATSARLSNPFSVCLDPSGNLIIADQTNHRIRKVDQFGYISTIVGTGTSGSSVDGTMATAANINIPTGIAYDAAGNLIFADRGNHCVRKVDAVTGTISTLINISNLAGFSGDGGAPATAQINSAPLVSLDPNGTMYVSDYSNNRIRKIQPIATNVAPVTGGSAVCEGATLALSDATIGGTWSSSNNTVATVGSTGIVMGVAGGLDTISYSLSFACGVVSSAQTVNVTALPAAPAPITGTPVVCVGTTTTLNDAVSGGIWSSTALPVATVGSTGIVTGASAGTATISYTFANACGTNAASTVVTVNAATGSISGASNLCVGATTTLTGVPAGGTWTSDNTTAATIGSSSGLVNALSAGNANITYTYGGGCTAVFPMTINPLPGAILGPGTVCAGSSITLTDGAGTWASGSPSIATIGSSSGIVNGVAPGTSVITFLLGTGCSATTTITVNAVPVAINPPGPVTMCVGATATLTDGTPGGAWSSAAPGVATVGTSGTVTGVLAGAATISYTNAIGCAATKDITVNITPTTLSPVSADVCIGSTTIFSESVGGGTWSSSASGTASVVGGTVTGVTVGNATISYTIGSCFVVAPVTVNANPAAITPPGGVDMCVGATATLGDASPGGTWSSGAAGTATVGTGGVVTGVLAGTVAISYTNSAGCSAIKVVTVDVTPTPLSPSGTIVCTGTTIILTDGVAGGTWTSSASGTASVAGGVVTGVAVGNATITYTIGTCFSIASITVNLSPNAGSVSGPSTMCVGTPITLTDAAGGGVWSSSNTAVATVGSTGIVTGVSGGTVMISYSVTNGCGTAVATTPETVNVPAIAGTITGPDKLCAGTVIVLSDASPGGVWSVTNSNASISSTGLLTGITPGIDTILYTVTNACGAAVATYVDTVGIFLTAGTISGPSTVCQGATITLTDPAPAGVWSSSGAGATVVGGTVTGVSGGITTISYTVSAVCGSASATHTVNVVPIPTTGSIAGPSAMCVGMVNTYTDAVGGGVWGTSNPVAVITPFGVVTALTVGTDTITYTVTNTCGTAAATTVLTIGPAISAGSISGPGAVCEAATITLTDAAPGGVWSASNVNAAVTGGMVTGATAGIDTIAYTVTSSCGSVAATKIVTVNPLPNAGSISGPSNVCVGATITLSDPVTGGSWSASNANAAVSGGVVTGVSLGSDIISYTVTNGCGTTSATATVNVTNIPSAGTITGPGNVCVGALITLTDPVSGGAWSASNTNASVSGGVITGLTAGTDIISYTVSSTCGTATATATITIDPLPSVGAISGPGDVCIGAAVTLTDPVAGGVWSASNTNASVSGGIVTGVASGTDVISYTVTNGCGSSFATSTVTIDPVPVVGAIIGTTDICAGGSTTLTDAVTGGIWSASNGRAIVAGGIVTGLTAGLDTISYTVTNACGTASASATVTVNPLPAAGTISGASSVCKSASITLTDAIAGGAWTAANSKATVTSAGVVTGVTVGTDTIMYTVTNTCGSAIAIKPVTIAQPPTVGAISGAASVCVGNTITLIDGSFGGTWSSASPAVATVSGAGVVSGVTVGGATISYTVANSCGSRAATHSVSVLPLASCESFTNGVNKGRDVFTVYPNPNAGAFSMSLVTSNDEPITVTITNIIGKTVKQFITTTNKVTDVQMNTAPGIYLLTATTANERYVVKVTIE